MQCAAGDTRFTGGDPANFFNGLWHGAISAITLILQIFSDTVKTYEVNNIGGWYDFGFWLAAISIYGSGSHHGARKVRKKNDKDWDKWGDEVEIKIKNKIRKWAEADDSEDWAQVEKKLESKIKKKLRDWGKEDKNS